MGTSTVVRQFESSEWPTYRDLRLRALADSPDAFGSTFAIEQARSANEWAQRLSAGVSSAEDLPLIAEANHTSAGLAWAKADALPTRTVFIYQMWVATEFRGRGLGRLLLRTAVAWARSQGAHSVRLGVTCGETPAVGLYMAEGFMPVGGPEPLRSGSQVLAQPMQLHINARAV
jgi:ribosomal protein S18 acetylase RimI-like enzyme